MATLNVAVGNLKVVAILVASSAILLVAEGEVEGQLVEVIIIDIELAQVVKTTLRTINNKYRVFISALWSGGEILCQYIYEISFWLWYLL